MKNIVLVTLFLLAVRIPLWAQNTDSYSHTLNVGLGVGGYAGYYGYAGRSIPVLHINYELGIVQNFTLAPFISIYTFSDNYYWGDNNSPSRFYHYRETVIPIGVKGTYYFDELLTAGSAWDFYLAASAGVAIVRSNWETGYNGDKNYYHGGRSAFVDVHIGAEYHVNHQLGVFLDLSSGFSTIGLAIH